MAFRFSTTNIKVSQAIKFNMKPLINFATLLSLFVTNIRATPFIVQSLSSRYALVLGGYGFGGQELASADVVKHDKVCPNVIPDVPNDLGRYLGAVSGMAEFVEAAHSVVYCRHSSCWSLRLGPNIWTKISGFVSERDRAASVAVNGTMVVLGGRGSIDSKGEDDALGFEVWNPSSDEWMTKPQWKMAKGRYSFCSVPFNETAVVVIGGYSRTAPLASVELLDVVTGNWERLPDLPVARYGHACLLMEWAGAEGILVSGGALTGNRVDFYDIKRRRWLEFPKLPLRVDGHKMILVEGIPTVFAWERIYQFDGKSWIEPFKLVESENEDGQTELIEVPLKLGNSRSAFTVARVPGHLVPLCS